MRLGVLDVGSNCAHLLVADARAGGAPVPVQSVKARLRLGELVDRDGRLGVRAIDSVVRAVAEGVESARRCAVDALFPYATAVVRDAPNRDQVLRAVLDGTGVRLGVLSGTEEARLTFLAVRRWLGWRTGPLLMLDIGGGSMEIAFGRDGVPDLAVSLPLGAGRLTREYLSGDPPAREEVAALRAHVRAGLRELRVPAEAARVAVAASRTFQQLARLAGAQTPDRGGDRHLGRAELRRWIDRLSKLPAHKRARLPGISRPRARQSLAGAVVAYEVMRRLGVDEVITCPWTLREGILLRQLEAMQPEPEGGAWCPVDTPVITPQPLPARQCGTEISVPAGHRVLPASLS